MSKAIEGKGSSDPTPFDPSAPGHSQSTAPRASGSSNSNPSKIVGSQAKRQEEVTRQGTQKMKSVVISQFTVLFHEIVLQICPYASCATEEARVRCYFGC